MDKFDKLSILIDNEFKSVIDKSVYIVNTYPRTRKNNKRVYLHRFLYENYYGVKLSKNIIIHHIDGNRRNCKISNLKAVMGRSNHLKLHNHYYKEIGDITINPNYITKLRKIPTSFTFIKK